MANFKRKKARINQYRYGLYWKHKDKYRRKYRDLYKNCPSWWNIIYHIRPSRRYNKNLLLMILKDNEEYYSSCFRNGKKPHVYYW